MELDGALSNPFATDKNLLIRLGEMCAGALARDPRLPSRPIRPRVGQILETVKQVLGDASEPLPVHEIHASCERILGREVVYSTVKDCLGNKRRQDPVFKRVRHGWYEANRPTE